MTSPKPTRSELESTIAASTAAFERLRAVQNAYDEVGWRVSEPLSAKYRHICLHLVDVVAQFAHIAERNDHLEDDGGPMDDAVLAERVKEHGILQAELMFSLLQLASIGDVDIPTALHDLYARNARHFAPDSVFAELEQRVYTEPLVF